MYRLRKVLVLFLVLCLSISLTSCGEGKQKSNKDSSVKTGDKSITDTAKKGDDTGEDNDKLGLPISKEKIEIEYLIYEHPNNPVKQDWFVFTELEKRTNIHIKLDPIGDEINEKLPLLASTDNLPDLFHPHVSMTKEYGPEGLLVPMNEYLDIMPNYNNFLEDNPKVKANITAHDGNIYMAPWHGIDVYFSGWLYRKDIFNKHNIDTPKTYDDLYNVLKTLKEIDPASYPFTHRKKEGFLHELTPAWGTGYSVYYDNDEGKYKYGFIEDNFKEMLIYFNKLHEEGLMDPEWATQDLKQWEDKMTTDKSYVTIDVLPRIYMFNEPMQEKNPEYELFAMLPPTTKKGKALIPTRPETSYGTGLEYTGFVVSKNNKHIEETLRWIDFLYSEEGSIITNFGVEGETYKVLADGTKVWTDDIESVLNPKGTKHPINDFGFHAMGTYAISMQEATKQKSTEEYNEALKLYADNNVGLPSAPMLTLTEEEIEQTKDFTSLGDYAKESITLFLLGQKSFDEWDEFVKEVNERYKVEELIDIYNTALERYKEFLD